MDLETISMNYQSQNGAEEEYVPNTSYGNASELLSMHEKVHKVKTFKGKVKKWTKNLAQDTNEIVEYVKTSFKSLKGSSLRLGSQPAVNTALKSTSGLSNILYWSLKRFRGSDNLESRSCRPPANYEVQVYEQIVCMYSAAHRYLATMAWEQDPAPCETPRK